MLVLYHYIPPPDHPAAGLLFLRGVREIRADGVLMSRDGTLVDLPAGSDEIHVSVIE